MNCNAFFPSSDVCTSRPSFTSYTCTLNGYSSYLKNYSANITNFRLCNWTLYPSVVIISLKRSNTKFLDTAILMQNESDEVNEQHSLMNVTGSDELIISTINCNSGHTSTADRKYVKLVALYVVSSVISLCIIITWIHFWTKYKSDDIHYSIYIIFQICSCLTLAIAFNGGGSSCRNECNQATKPTLCLMIRIRTMPG